MLAGMNVATNGAHSWGVGSAPVLSMALAFGGAAQFIAGLIMMRRGEIFPGSAFMGYGAFWFAFTFLVSGVFVNTSSVDALGAAGAYGVAWFMVVWAMWTFSFAINSHYHGIGIAFVFWTLVLAFILLAVDFGLTGAGKTVSNGLWQATGIETFICGAAAWYVATGVLTSHHHGGKKVIPY